MDQPLPGPAFFAYADNDLIDLNTEFYGSVHKA